MIRDGLEKCLNSGIFCGDILDLTLIQIPFGSLMTDGRCQFQLFTSEEDPKRATMFGDFLIILL